MCNGGKCLCSNLYFPYPSDVRRFRRSLEFPFNDWWRSLPFLALSLGIKMSVDGLSAVAFTNSNTLASFERMYCKIDCRTITITTTYNDILLLIHNFFCLCSQLHYLGQFDSLRMANCDCLEQVIPQCKCPKLSGWLGVPKSDFHPHKVSNNATSANCNRLNRLKLTEDWFIRQLLSSHAREAFYVQIAV